MSDEIIKTVELSGFDAAGEPELHIMANNELRLVFNFMPPSGCEDEAAYDEFDEELAAAIGVEVEWEDREVFLIQAPKADTAQRIAAFVANYHKNKGVRHFEMDDGTARKFWQVSVDDCELTVKFGRIGTAGQTKVKEFDDAAEANKERDKLIREKTKKGYEEVEAVGEEDDDE